MKGGVDVHPHQFLTSALEGSEWPASRHSHFTPREEAPVIHYT